MQKFTRALTREIEVNGERLAVTFNAEGMSVRPVGSRKPPLHLTWGAVLCALTSQYGEPTAEDLAQALGQIHAGAGAKPRPLFTSAKTADLANLLKQLDSWLQKNRKRYHGGLLPGATEKQLDQLSEALGRPTPEDLVVWLRWHNGQNEDLIGAFVESFNLMSVPEIIHALDERKSQKGWNPAFIPILDDYQDNLVVVDTSKKELPVREVWRGRDDHPEAATSFTGWVAMLLGAFEAGRYREDPERGEFLRSQRESE